MGDFGWGGDVEEADDGDSSFADEMEQAIESGNISEDTTVDDLRSNLLDVSDTELLKRAYIADHREEAEELYRKRLHALDAAPPEGETEQASLSEAADEESESSVAPEDDTEETEESDTSDVDAESDDEGFVESAADDLGAALDTDEDYSATEPMEPPGETVVTGDGGENSEPEEGDPFADLGGDSMNSEEAVNREHRRRVMVWGPEGVGKTHFAYTSEDPIAIIDTEGKAHDIAEKFEDKTLRIWQPESYTEATDHLEQAMEWLQAWFDERDQRGTLVVDSMSIMWEWSKQNYIRKYYIETPDPKYEDPSDVDLKSSLESQDPDWPKIKEYHNEKFRKPMVQSPFHLVWTAMATEDFGEAIERNLDKTPDKPAGEKENVFKVNYIVHVRENSQGVPVGDLEKSGLTRHTFAGMEWPTYPDVFQTVEELNDAEQAESAVSPEKATEADVTILSGKPSRLRGVKGDEDE